MENIQNTNWEDGMKYRRHRTFKQPIKTYYVVYGQPVRMRKNPFDCMHDGVWMSRNGSKDFNRGAKPLFMWDCPESELEPMIPHHIGIGTQERCTFELVMFYRKKSHPSRALSA